jgi:hypothetical protein
MRKPVCHLMVLLSLSTLATADDQELLREELRNAADREQRELVSREEALAEQVETAARLLQRQQEYIEQLEARIRALQDSPDRSD